MRYKSCDVVKILLPSNYFSTVLFFPQELYDRLKVCFRLFRHDSTDVLARILTIQAHLCSLLTWLGI